MSAIVLPFPTARRAPDAPAPEPSDKGTPRSVMPAHRFTKEARNALNALTYALPLWGVRFEENVSGGECAAIFDIRGGGYALIFVAPEADGRLGLYDVRGEPLRDFETTAEFVSAMRLCF